MHCILILSNKLDLNPETSFYYKVNNINYIKSEKTEATPGAMLLNFFVRNLRNFRTKLKCLLD